MKKLLIILGAIFIAVGGVLFASTLSKRGAYTETANKYMSYINSGDSERSYSLLSERQKGIASAEDWKKYVDKVSDKFPPSCDQTAQIDINDADKTYTSDDKAAKYACDFKLDGSDYRIIFVFINEKSNIVIDELQGYSMQ